ncbi:MULTISPECIES: hypothetical protein [Nocardiopsidaceae]|uniref:TrbL/VirB6 plasmid conjugal transfer protein n=1 Tax=Streptomonospora nanhaiensis TaxID=1323731 RepID=A0ABY6YNW9_9ACTN|nr:hypothetical protein [Streptomonospora nanhaiensis]WAE73908.1 hypothetical protein OUQ99_01915 [Streptomonospora nanhaiensis]
MENEETANWITESLQGIIERMFTLLINSGSGAPLQREYGSNQLVVDQGVLQLQNVFNPLILFLATLGILLAAVRLLWTRRLDPMMDLVRGLLTVIITTFAGLFFVYVLSGFSSGLTQMILETGSYRAPLENGAPGTKQVNFLEAAKTVYPSIMRVGVGGNDLGFTEDSAREAVTYLISLAVTLGLIAQMIVLAMLKSIVYLLSCLLPLAAASSLVPGLKIFPKVIGWLFACLLYKPLLLLVYLSGLVLIATTEPEAEGGLSRYLLGAAVMLMATGALPVLMKLMSSGSVWMMALAAGGISSIGGGGGGGGGGNGSGADASPSSASGSPSAGSAPSADGGAQAAAAGANERAAGVARNLDEGGAGQPAGGGSSAVAASAAGTGAVDTGTMGTQGGLGTGAGGPLGGADGTASVDGAMGGPEGGGAQDGGAAAAAGATESVSSTTVSGSEQGYSQTVASGAGGDGGSDPGAVGDAPAGAGAADTGAVSGGASGGGYPGGAGAVSPEGASGAQFADGADGRMV